MFPALLISLKFRKVKQAKVNRKLTNNSETWVLQKFHFSKKVERNFDQNQYKIAVKSEEKKEGIKWMLANRRPESRGRFQDWLTWLKSQYSPSLELELNLILETWSNRSQDNEIQSVFQLSSFWLGFNFNLWLRTILETDLWTRFLTLNTRGEKNSNQNQGENSRLWRWLVCWQSF